MKLASEFYAFMIERESIRLRRLAGLPPDQWTADPVLRQFRFTNVKRWHDWTTTRLREDFYKPHASHDPGVILLNCALFRFFGTVEFARELGWQATWNGRTRQRACKLAAAGIAAGRTVFTNAYIVPNCGEARPKHEVVADVVSAVHARFRDMGDPGTLYAVGGWERFCGELQEIRAMGPFMAKEVALDFLMATGWYPSDWSTWTPVGPGARRGAARVLHGELDRPLGERPALAVCRQLYDLDADLWPEEICGQPSVELDLTDVQFQLCEFDKHQRAARGEGRPKNRFSPRKS